MTSTDKAPEHRPFDIKQEFIRADLYDTLAADNEALQAEVERLQKQRDQAESRYTRACQMLDRTHARAEKAETERDTIGMEVGRLTAERGQALALLAVVQQETIERCAKAMNPMLRSMLDRRQAQVIIRALPIDPDAEAALKRMLDAEWNKAVEACAVELEHHHTDEAESLLCDIWQERIRALTKAGRS